MRDRLQRFVSCALCVLLVAGCTSATERVVAWYITRKLDGYLDLTSEQKKAARARVDESLATLRGGELSHWISFLREVRQGLHEGMSEVDVERLQRHYDARLDAGVDLLAPRFAPLLAALSPAQVDHFAERMREDVDEHYEDLKMPPAKRRANVEERVLDYLEDFVGDLSDRQEDEVRALIRAQPDERHLQYRSAHANIGRFRAFLATGPDAAAIEAELHAMWQRRYDGLGPGRDKSVRRAEQRKALYAVYRMLDAEQRAHAEEELTERIQKLKRFLPPPG